MITIDTAEQLSSSELLSGVTRLAAEGRHAVADLIALLPVVEERKLYAGEGYSSVFRFCVGRLHLSEEEAYYRIAAGRVALRFPVVLERLRQGSLTLTNVALLRKHLTEENHERLLQAAEGRSKREVQALIATLAPRPDVRTSIRKLPPQAGAFERPGVINVTPAAAAYRLAADRCEPSLPSPWPRKESAGPCGFDPPAGVARTDMNDRPTAPIVLDAATTIPYEAALAVSHLVAATPPAAAPVTPLLAPSATSSRPAVVCQLAPTRYSLRVTISEETHAKLRRAQDLLSHSVASGDAAAVIDRALTLLIAQLERRKFAARRRAQALPAVAAPARQPQPGRAAPRSSATIASTPEEKSSQAPDPRTPGAGGGSSRLAPARRSRYIPAAVRREVWRRDGERCAFVAPDGRRCEETARLAFHHKVPFAEGGEATPSNLEVRCVAHNALEAGRWFGEEVTNYRGRNDKTLEKSEGRHPCWTKLTRADISSPSSG